jgi:signal peptidase I
MRRAIGLLFALAAVLGAVLSGRIARRFVVDGRSMLQAYHPGDKLVAEGVSYRLRQPRVGEAVVVQWPNGLKRPPGSPTLDLKRIAAGPGAEVTVVGEPDFLGEDEWFLVGDNLDESTDSRELGPVKTRDLVGRVWFKY